MFPTIDSEDKLCYKLRLDMQVSDNSREFLIKEELFDEVRER